MALDSKNNIKSVFILPTTATTAVTAGTKVTPGSLTLGSVVITNVSNEVLATTATGTIAAYDPTLYDKIKIVKDRGANLPLQQVTLKRSEVTSATSVGGKLASEQVSYVGFDGASGNMDAIGDNFYLIKLEHLPNSFIYGKRPANYKYGTFQSTSSTSALIVSEGLIKSLIQNFKPNRNIDWRVFTNLVADGAGVVVADTDLTSITFTKYSKTARVATGAAVSAFAAGTYLRVGAGATTYTNPVVKIVSSGSAVGTEGFNIVLDNAWQGETTTVLRVDLYTVATPGNVGVQITGIKQKYDVNRWRQYNKVRFNVLLENFSAGINVSTTGANEGIAVYEQVANDEYISWGDEGQVFVDQVPPQFREQDAVIGQQYQPAVIGWLDNLNSLIGAGENKGQAILYFAGGTGTSTYTPTGGQLQAALITTFNLWSNVDLPTTFVYS
jgi:hypothetical protein